MPCTRAATSRPRAPRRVNLADTALGLAPADYGALWRAARELFDESDAPSCPTTSARGSDSRPTISAERAIAVNPNDAAAQYWAALSIGRYAEKMGVLSAIAKGIEGKFKRPLERATALDVSYDHGNVPVVWAAYYLELPWPKRDRDKAAKELRRALAINPANLRARLYQARIAATKTTPTSPGRLLAAIAAAPVGRYDAPEERAVKKEAAAMAAKLADPTRVEPTLPRDVSSEARTCRRAPLGGGDRVHQQHRDRHRADAARNRRDGRGARGRRRELDVAQQLAVVAPVDADVDHHRARLDPFAADHLGAPDRRHHQIGARDDRRRDRGSSSGRRSPSRPRW